MSRPFLAALAVAISLLSATSTLRAAPQVLAVIADGTPIRLQCRNGECAAEVSTICLQLDRPQPTFGTAYTPWPAPSAVLSLELRRPDGGRVVLDPGELRFTSLRDHLALRVSLPASAVLAAGPGEVRLRPRGPLVLAPLPVAGDRRPQTAREVDAAADRYRHAATTWAGGYRESLAVVGALNRAINGLEAGMAAREPDVATRLNRIQGRCAARAGDLARACLSREHDMILRAINEDYWDSAVPGS